MGGHCSVASHCILCQRLTCGDSFFLIFTIFRIFFANDCRCLWNNCTKIDSNYFTEGSGFSFNYVSKLTNKCTNEKEKKFHHILSHLIC